MRIAIDAHNIGQRETGNEAYTLELLRALTATSNNHSFDVITPSPSQVDQRLLLPANFHLVRVRPAAALMRIPFGIPLALRGRHTDLLHVTYVAPPVIACRTVVTIHDLSFLIYPHFLSHRVRRMLRVLVPFSARRAMYVIAISEFTKREIVGRLGIEPDRIAVTHLAAASTYSFRTDAKAFSLPSGVTEPYILAVGNLEPRKNLLRLISAFDRLRRDHRFEGQLVLVGQPAWRSLAVRREVEEKGLGSQIIFTGYVQDAELNILYNRAVAFVYPSLYEGFGLPPVEAMAAGCPVVASNVTALPEILGEAAILVDPTSIEQIMSALAAIVERPELARALRQKGFARAARYSWDRTAEQTLSIYWSASSALRGSSRHSSS